jgi:phosphohistidine phosphatase
MLTVCFFRHGPAVAHGTPGIPENERPLSPEGQRKTLRAARGLRRLALKNDGILSSPLPRALETAQILAETLGLPAPRATPQLLPESPPRLLLECLREAGWDRPILVGHEPGLSAAVSALLRAPESGACELKKAGMALVRLRKLHPRPEGTLLLLLTPSALRLLGR